MTPTEIAEKYFPESMIRDAGDVIKRKALILFLADDIERYANHKALEVKEQLLKPQHQNA